MKYFARIGQTEYEVEIEANQVRINGELIEVDLMQGGVPGFYSMIASGRSYELLVETKRFNYDVTLRGEQFQVQIEDERTRRLNSGRRAPALPAGELAVKAPIPGLVIQVLIAIGETIAEGQPLVILGAMKMENEIRSLRAGVVKSIAVKAGQPVDKNETLLVME